MVNIPLWLAQVLLLLKLEVFSKLQIHMVAHIYLKKVKQGYSDDLADKRICQEIHSSELQSIFFETQDNKDCFHDPMSIYR